MRISDGSSDVCSSDLRIDTMLAQHPGDQCAITDIADHQLGATHRIAKSGTQIVDDDNALATCDQLLDNMTADVTGTTGDEDAVVHDDEPPGTAGTRAEPAWHARQLFCAT